MSSVVFDLMQLLDKERVHYSIQRTRSETIQFNTTFVGARIEIEVFEDNHIEISKFVGNEDVESGDIEMVKKIIKTYS